MSETTPFELPSHLKPWDGNRRILVNVWNLEGGFILGGTFSGLDAAIDALKSKMPELNDRTVYHLHMLYDENSSFGVPEYCGQVKASIKNEPLY